MTEGEPKLTEMKIEAGAIVKYALTSFLKADALVVDGALLPTSGRLVPHLSMTVSSLRMGNQGVIRGQVEINSSSLSVLEVPAGAMLEGLVNRTMFTGYKSIVVAGTLGFEHMQSYARPRVHIYAENNVVVRSGGILQLKVADRTTGSLAGAELHTHILDVRQNGTLEIVGAASLFVDVLNVSGTLKATGGRSLAGTGTPACKFQCWRVGSAHGGFGGRNTYHTIEEGYTDTYGSIIYPTSVGSRVEYRSTASGGGAVRVIASSTVTVGEEGALSAVATKIAAGHDHGTGSGGSVLVIAPRIISYGRISADGGAKERGSSSCGMGGGGRVALHAEELVLGPAAEVTAVDGKASREGNGQGNAGTAGTVFIFTKSQFSRGNLFGSHLGGTEFPIFWSTGLGPFPQCRFGDIVVNATRINARENHQLGALCLPGNSSSTPCCAEFEGKTISGNIPVCSKILPRSALPDAKTEPVATCVTPAGPFDEAVPILFNPGFLLDDREFINTGFAWQYKFETRCDVLDASGIGRKACSNSMLSSLGDGKCNQACNNLACAFDNRDCPVTDITVSPVTGSDENTVEDAPFQTLSRALHVACSGFHECIPIHVFIGEIDNSTINIRDKFLNLTGAGRSAEFTVEKHAHLNGGMRFTNIQGQIRHIAFSGFEPIIFDRGTSLTLTHCIVEDSAQLTIVNSGVTITRSLLFGHSLNILFDQSTFNNDCAFCKMYSQRCASPMCTAEEGYTARIPAVVLTHLTLKPSRKVGGSDQLISGHGVEAGYIQLQKVSLTEHEHVLIESGFAMKGNTSLRSKVDNVTNVKGWSLDGQITFRPHQDFTFTECRFTERFSFDLTSNATTRIKLEDVAMVAAGARESTVRVISADALQAISINQTQIRMLGLLISNRALPASLHGNQTACDGTRAALLDITGDDVSRVICKSCRFVSNTRQCIAVTGGATLELQGCTLRTNKVLSCGSPLKISTGGTLIAADTMFASNEAYTSSGAINIAGADSVLHVHRSTFSKNLARNANGGAIAAAGGAHVVISKNVWFKDNEADLSGGAIYIADPGSTFHAHSNVVFSNNLATHGGAVAAIGKDLLATLRQASFSGANRAFRGGALYIGDGATVFLDHVTVKGAMATNGAGIFVSVRSAANLTSCVLQGNTATASGGAVEARTDSSIALQNTSIRGNVAPNAAGVRLKFTSSLEVRDRSEISGNTETSLLDPRWWESQSAGHSASGVDCASGSSMALDAESRIEHNKPYNFACDSDCDASGISVACVTDPLLITGLTGSSCTSTGQGHIQISLSDNTIPPDVGVALWIGASHAYLQDAIHGPEIRTPCLPGTGSNIPVRVYVEGTRRSWEAPSVSLSFRAPRIASLTLPDSTSVIPANCGKSGCNVTLRGNGFGQMNILDANMGLVHVEMARTFKGAYTPLDCARHSPTRITCTMGSLSFTTSDDDQNGTVAFRVITNTGPHAQASRSFESLQASQPDIEGAPSVTHNAVRDSANSTTHVTLRWCSVSNKCRSNGSPILEYMLEAQRSNGWDRVYQGTKMSHIITLNDLTATMYRVRARNKLGWSPERIASEYLAHIGCDRGMYKTLDPVSALPKCVKCPEGWVSLTSGLQGACVKCEPGRFNDVEGHYACKRCPDGQFSTPASPSMCQDCEAGKYQTGPTCVDCPEGYVALSGSSRCRACPPGKSSRGSLTTCMGCPAGKAQSIFGRSSCTNCGPREYSSPDGIQCQECPRVGATCNGFTLEVHRGFWFDNRYGDELNRSVQLYPCINSAACRPTINNVTKGWRIVCATGHRGRLCGECGTSSDRGNGTQSISQPSVAWVRSGEMCTECFSHSTNVLLTTFVMLLLFAGLIFLILYQDFDQKQKRMIVLRQLLSHSQMLGAFGMYKARGPSVFRQLVGWVKTAGGAVIGFFPLVCATRLSFYGQFTMQMLMPVTVLPVIALFTKLLFRKPVAVNVQEEDSNGDAQGWWPRAQALMVFVYFCMYPSLVQQIFLIMHCTDPVEGVRYLTEDLSIPCDDDAHKLIVGTSILCGVIYCLGFPLFLVWLLIRNQDQLHNASFHSRFGFLYDGYALRRGSLISCWEVTVLIRKAFTVMLATIVEDPYTQTMLAILMLSILLLMHVQMHPYAKEWLNHLETMSLFALLVTQTFCIMYLHIDNQRLENNAESAGTKTVAINAADQTVQRAKDVLKRTPRAATRDITLRRGPPPASHYVSPQRMSPRRRQALAVSKLRQCYAFRPNAYGVYAMWDTNRDGGVDAEEMLQQMQSHGISWLTTDDCNDLIHRFSGTRKGGRSRKLQYPAFVHMVFSRLHDGAQWNSASGRKAFSLTQSPTLQAGHDAIDINNKNQHHEHPQRQPLEKMQKMMNRET
eukprot:g4008.t1